MPVHEYRLTIACCLLLGCVARGADPTARGAPGPDGVKDLTLLVGRNLPCVWPLGMTPFASVPTASFGRSGRHRDMLLIDEHTGTQWDAPAHFVPPPGSGLPGAGPMGNLTGEQVPAWQFCGEACVIDITALRDKAEPGTSHLIGPDVVRGWEIEHRPLGPGDVVLFHSGYTDAYYKPFPAGDRFVATVLAKKAPGWPAPTPETMTYLADRGVTTLAIDSASMGPLPNMAVATHQAGGSRGMIVVECGANFGSLPATGSFIAILAAKHAGGSGSECRCVAVTDPPVAAELIARARRHDVADLSVTLDEQLPIVWSGRSPGDEGAHYVSQVLNRFSRERGPFFALTHLFDSMAGTHLVLPGFSLPADDAERVAAEPALRAVIESHEKEHGPLGTSTLRTEAAPLERMMGPVHVVDVRGLRGTAAFAAGRPAGSVISREFLQRHAAARPFKPGEVVLFFSGYCDEKVKPLPAAPEQDGCFVQPLAGTAEGWPAPSAEAVAWLAEQGVRCLGTDGPTLGGVDAEAANHADWLAASKGMLVVEMLVNLGAIADREAFFIVAPIKIEGTRGGYGRALALVGK